jgi:hypothetical protein
MKKKILIQMVPALVLAGLLTGGSVATGNQGAPQMAAQPQAVVEQKTKNVYAGKVAGVSKKAKSISMEVGKGDQAKMIMIKFDDNTKGLEHAKAGEAAIIAYEVRGNDKVATEIKPKLAKLPEGVTEMRPEELVNLLVAGPGADKYVLIDSRPGPRYAEGHISTAISIPVAKLKEKGEAVLPAENDILLVFYCGGVT